MWGIAGLVRAQQEWKDMSIENIAFIAITCNIASLAFGFVAGVVVGKKLGWIEGFKRGTDHGKALQASIQEVSRIRPGAPVPPVWLDGGYTGSPPSTGSGPASCNGTEDR